MGHSPLGLSRGPMAPSTEPPISADPAISAMGVAARSSKSPKAAGSQCCTASVPRPGAGTARRQTGDSSSPPMGTYTERRRGRRLHLLRDDIQDHAERRVKDAIQLLLRGRRRPRPTDPGYDWRRLLRHGVQLIRRSGPVCENRADIPRGGDGCQHSGQRSGRHDRGQL